MVDPGATGELPLPEKLVGPLQELARAFFVVEQALWFYPEGHQARQVPLTRLTQAMTVMLADRRLVHLGFTVAGLRWEGEPFGEVPGVVRKFIDRRLAQGIAGISWSAGLTVEEVGKFVASLTEHRSGEEQWPEACSSLAHLAVEKFDYSTLTAKDATAMSQDHQEGWHDLLRRGLVGGKLEIRPGDEALLCGLGDDPGVLAQAVFEIVGEVDGEGQAAVAAALRRITDTFARAGPDGAEPPQSTVDHLRLAASHLPDELRFALLEQVLDAPSDSLFTRAFGALSPEQLIRLLASNFALDPDRIMRLTRVFQKLVPRRLDRMELTPLLRDMLQHEKTQEDMLAVNTCEEVEELLTGEAGDFMSPSYREMLQRLSCREESRMKAEHLIAHLVEIAPHLQPARTAEKILRVRFEHLRLATSDERFREELALLTGICRGSFAAGDHQSGVVILAQLVDLRREEPSAPRVGDLEGTLRELGSPEMIEDLLLAHARAGAMDRAAIREVLFAAPQPPVPQIFEALASERDAEKRRELAGWLVTFGPAAVTPALARLDGADHEEAGTIVSILAALRHPDAVQGLLGVLQREQPRLRREALKALIGIDLPEVRRALVPLLSDLDEEIVQLVADHLGVSGDRDAEATLIRDLDCGLFAGMRAGHLKRAVFALGRMRSRSAVHSLAELLRRRTWVSRRAQEEIGEAAARALGRIGGDEARRVLERAAVAAPSTVAAVCRRVLSRGEAP